MYISEKKQYLYYIIQIKHDAYYKSCLQVLLMIKNLDRYANKG